VAQTITEICEGIKEAQKNNHELLLAPHIGADGSVSRHVEDYEKPQILHFDLSIIASEETAAGTHGGKFRLQVASVGISAEGSPDQNVQSSKKEQHVSFDIPVIWPTTQQRSNRNHVSTAHRHGNSYS